MSETILTNIRVLAIGQNIQERNGEKVVTGETATLELTPAQAEMITLAQKIGQLSLALRSLADANQTQDAPRSDRAEERADRSSATASPSNRRSGEETFRVQEGLPDGIDPPQNGKQGSAARRGPLAPLRRRSLPAPATRLTNAALAESVRTSGVGRRLDLSIGRSLIIDLPRDAKEVFVANPKVANAVVRSTRKVFLIGMENGATSIFVMDAEGRQIAALEVIVGRDLNVLTQTLRTAMPQAQVEVSPAGDSILLTGLVASASEAQQAVDIANAFVGVSGGSRREGRRHQRPDDPQPRPGDAPGHRGRGRAHGPQAVRHQHLRQLVGLRLRRRSLGDNFAVINPV